MRLGEASGAVAALAILQARRRRPRRHATFAEAGVSTFNVHHPHRMRFLDLAGRECEVMRMAPVVLAIATVLGLAPAARAEDRLVTYVARVCADLRGRHRQPRP